MCGLALYSVAYSVREIMGVAAAWERVLDWCIYGAFVIDYVVFLLRSENKGEYVREHICEVIALIPFDSLFRAARLLRLLKLARLLGVVARLFRFFGVARDILNTNGLKYMIFVCVCILLIGAVVYMRFEGSSFSDGLWWSAVTMYTVGYGDISPSSDAGRIAAVALMFSGVGFIGALSSSMTTYFLSPNRKVSDCSDALWPELRDLLSRDSELSDPEFDYLVMLLRARRENRINRLKK